MKRVCVSALSVACAATALVAATTLTGRASGPAAMRPVPAHAGTLSNSEARAVIEQYCLQCHDQDHAKGDLVLETFDPAKADQRADIGEKMIHKLRAGLMP